MENYKELGHITKFLGVISQPHRLKILYLLKDGEKCVCEIQPKVKIAGNLLSHHLKVLKNFGLVKSRKNGLNVYYSLNGGEMDKNRKFFAKAFKIDW